MLTHVSSALQYSLKAVSALAKKPHNSSVPFKRNHADTHHKALGMVMLTKLMYLCAFIYVYMCLYTGRHIGICV